MFGSSHQGRADARDHPAEIVIGDGQTPVMFNRGVTCERVRP